MSKGKDNVTFFSPNRFVKLENATSMRNHAFELMVKAAATKAEQQDAQRFLTQTQSITQAQQNHTTSPMKREPLTSVFHRAQNPGYFVAT